MKGTAKTATLLAAALLAATPAWAVNKCTVGGKTVYQDAPCADGGEKVNLSGAGPSDAAIMATRSNAAALCEAALRTEPAWKDASSLQVTNMKRTGFTTIKMHGTTLVAVQYSATVNGKNSYGAYAGQKPAFCFLNETETKVLKIMAL